MDLDTTLSVGERDEVIWHDLECGSYRVDLGLWSELAHEHNTPLLDVGAGSGRVALHLASEGHRVTALDRSQELLRALRERAGSLAIDTVCADARSFELPTSEAPGLIIVPMQTIQLLGGPQGRQAFFSCALANMRYGALLACAIVCDFEAFDCTIGDPGPSAEQAQHGDLLYRSRATQVRLAGRAAVLKRERTVIPLGRPEPEARHEENIIELDLVSPEQLQEEASAAGLEPAGFREITATEEYTASTVVMMRA